MASIVLPRREVIRPGWGDAPSHPGRARQSRWRRLLAGAAATTRLAPGSCCGCGSTPVGCSGCIPAVDLTFSAYSSTFGCTVTGTMVYHPPGLAQATWSCGIDTLTCGCGNGTFYASLACSGTNGFNVDVGKYPQGTADCFNRAPNQGLVITSTTCGPGFLMTLDFASSGLSAGCISMRDGAGLSGMTISA